MTLYPTFHRNIALPLLLSAWLSASLSAAETPQVELKDLPPFETRRGNLVHHNGTYPPTRVRWVKDRSIHDGRAIFPHPLLPTHAVLTTDKGARLTTDKGKTWRDLPGLTQAKVGTLTWVAFRPDRTDAYYLGTMDRGLWFTQDNGKTAHQIATKKKGLLADRIRAVYVYPYDRRLETLLVTHEDAAAGISRSEDGGATWDAVARKYYARYLLFGKNWYMPTFYMAAAPQAQPDVYGIYSTHLLGKYWFEMVRDINPTGASDSLISGRGLYWSTVSAGLLRTNRAGARVERVGPEAIDNWANVGVTYGPHADAQMIYAFAPTAGGMLLTEDEFATHSFQSRGLFNGPYVAEGAMIRANGNGTIFYALVNGALYRGYPVRGPLRVHRVEVSPPVVSVAPLQFRQAWDAIKRNLRVFAESRDAAAAAPALAQEARRLDAAFPASQVRLTAAIAGQVKPAKVTVDLSRVGGSARTPLFDDGEHEDGAAEDGVYGCDFRLSAHILSRGYHEWRRGFPGTGALSVTAVTPEGGLAGAVGLFTFLHRSESFVWWDDFDYARNMHDPEGALAASIARGSDETQSGHDVLQITTQGGPWRVSFGSHWRHDDITGYHAISFWIKSDSAKPEELFLQLMDSPEEAYPASTKRVALLAGRHVQGGAITSEYRKVVIPLRPLLHGDSEFHPQLFAFIVFSGDGKVPRTYCIDNIRCHLTADDLRKDR